MPELKNAINWKKSSKILEKGNGLENFNRTNKLKTELQEKLFDKYHKIFRDKDESPMETAICWGIECGDGWG